MGEPIASILILNTVANSGGAALAGSIVVELYTPEALALFTAFFVATVLIFSEIIPKQLGVRYAKVVAPRIALPLLGITKMLWPAVLISKQISRIFTREDTVPRVSSDELLSIAKMGIDEGVLDDIQATVITNSVRFDEQTVKDVLTPRVVVFRLECTMKLREIKDKLPGYEHTRIPIYAPNDPEHVAHYVIQRDVYSAMLQGKEELTLKDVSRPLNVVPDVMPLGRLTSELFNTGDHILGVVSEHGTFVGIVTLEDVFEQLIGREIVDEFDKTTDMRQKAVALIEKKLAQNEEK